MWIDEFRDEVVDVLTEAVELEKIYAYEACSEDTLGMSAGQFAENVDHVADRRVGQLDLPEQYETDNPFHWLSEQVDLNKEKTFFETQVAEYQSGGSLDW